MMRLKLWIGIVLMAVVLQGCNTLPPEKGVNAIDGILDLSHWSTEETPLIPLEGSWIFYWQHLLTPSDFEQQSGVRPTGMIVMPSNWESYLINGRPLPREGYATFRLNVYNGPSSDVLGLKVPVMYSSYKLWVDDKLLSRNGQVGINKETSVPQKKPMVVYFSPEDNNFTITLQISNYHEYSGGMWEPVTLGLSKDIHADYVRQVISQSLMIGILLLSGIYHLGLSLFRKTDSYFFYFGLFCVVAALRYMMVGDVFLTKLAPSIDWGLAMKIEYISLYLHVPLWGMVMYRLYPKDCSRRFIAFCTLVAAGYTVLTLFLETRVYYQFLIYFQLLMILGALYSFVVILNGARRKREGAVYGFIGILSLLACIIIDTFGFMLKYSGLNLYPVGIVIFIISFSLMISKRLSASLSLSEQLTAELSELNHELEQKVEDRTREIQHSHNKLMELNLKLEQMVLVDGLTSIANRKHFDEYFEEQFTLCAQRSEPLTLFYIDIDDFKRYNDRYGHLMGDECLKQVAQTLHEQVSVLPGGLAARYGGEEFVCILPGCDGLQAEQLAGELNRHIEQLHIPHMDSQVSGVVTISIGLTSVIPGQSLNPKDILEQADLALYQAKSAGKNRHVRFSASF
ncbi:hypothetical protein DNH61_01075 [Paenibacillus sambharensis]|uniref:GGDEF domain-containing protein n=1 Tax=Paenibacillus sambharensis TaxID=1803190 RepID=A0A2W1LHG0_9BACL|nr:diguanylate cyclase [Paenibacillus sambharensis]PZD97500.1 hypothetical protein DNH61_01075 [Paenibacillus sambharensis]